jgi:hypothetical protein
MKKRDMEVKLPANRAGSLPYSSKFLGASTVQKAMKCGEL